VDERELLLLGILSVQSQHGYQINEFIERNLSRVTDMKKPTAYALLERLGQAGYVEVRSQQEGKRPPRKVYSITSAGKQLFLDLLRDNLAHAERMTFAGDVGLMFLDHLPREEALDLLRLRLKRLGEQISVYEQSPRHEHSLGVDLAMQHILVLLRAEQGWLAATIERLQAA
jgi:DNA-binding PadR family transcriptional regulator